MCYHIIHHHVRCDVRCKIMTRPGAAHSAIVNAYMTKPCDASCPGDSTIANWLRCTHGHKCCLVTAEFVRCNAALAHGSGQCLEPVHYHTYDFRPLPQERAQGKVSPWAKLPTVDEQIPEYATENCPMPPPHLLHQSHGALRAATELHDATIAYYRHSAAMLAELNDMQNRVLPALRAATVTYDRHTLQLLEASMHLSSPEHVACRAVARDWPAQQRWEGEDVPECCLPGYEEHVVETMKAVLARQS